MIDDSYHRWTFSEIANLPACSRTTKPTITALNNPSPPRPPKPSEPNCALSTPALSKKFAEAKAQKKSKGHSEPE